MWTRSSTLSRVPDRSFSAPICSITVSRCSAVYLRTRTLRWLETRAEGKGEPKGRVLVTARCLSSLGKQAWVLTAIFANRRRRCPQTNTYVGTIQIHTERREEVSLDYQIINLFPELIDCEKEKNKRFSPLTHRGAPTTESTAVGLGLIPLTSKSADSWKSRKSSVEHGAAEHAAVQPVCFLKLDNC